MFNFLLPFLLFGSPNPQVTKGALALITYHGEAKPLSKVLTEISAVSNLHLETNDTLKNDIMVVDVTNVTAKDLMDHIADVELGDWLKSGSNMILVPSDKKVKAQFDERISDATRKFGSQLKNNPWEIRPPAIGGKSPPVIDEPDKNIVRAIGLDTLASIPAGVRVVYSSKPNASQLPFPSSAIPDVEKILNQHLPHPFAKQDFYFANTSGQINPNTPTFVGYTSDGMIEREIPENSMNLRFFAPAPTQAQSTAEKPDLKMEKPVVVTGNAKKILDAMTQLNEGHGTQPKIDATTMQILEHFAMYDPLLLAGAYLASGAEAKNLNLVGCLPDTDDVIGSMNGGTPTQIVSEISQNISLSFFPSNGWLCFAPKDPDFIRSTRIDRNYLDSLFSEHLNQNDLSVDQIAGFAAAIHGRISQILVDRMALIKPSWVGPLFTQDLKAAELYDRLSAIQKQELIQNKSFSYSQLSPEARKLVEAMAFGSEFKLQYDPGTEDIKLDPALVILNKGRGSMGGEQPGDPVSYRSEPTEVAPNGFSEKTIIEGSISVVPVYQFVGDNTQPLFEQLFSTLRLDADQLAANLPDLENPGKGPAEKLLGVKEGTRTILTIKVYLAPGIYVGGRIYENSVPENATIIGMDQLPKVVKDKIALVKKYLDDQKSKMPQLQPSQTP